MRRTRRGRSRAVIGHVVAVGTWRSLVVDEGVPPAIAVELEVRWVLDAAAAASRQGIGTWSDQRWAGS